LSLLRDLRFFVVRKLAIVFNLGFPDNHVIFLIKKFGLLSNKQKLLCLTTVKKPLNSHKGLKKELPKLSIYYGL